MIKALLRRAGSVTGAFYLCTSAYVLLLCWACQAKLANYGYKDFDLAVHAQSVWNLLHGSLNCSLLGVPFLGNHMAVILFLLAPLYAFVPTPLLLLHLQTLGLASAVVAIYRLAEREIPRTWALGVSMIYLVYPPLILLNLYEFHPIAFAVPLLTWMLYFYRKGNFLPFVVCLSMALACQENVALIAVAFSFYALCERRKGRWFWTPFLAGALYILVVVFLLMPRLSCNTIQFMKLYAHLGSSPMGIAGNVMAHPLRTIGFMFCTEKLIFLNALVGPVAYLSLLSPLSLLPAVFVMAQRLLSARLSEASIAYHYQAEFIPFVFFAAIFGIKRLLGLRHRLTSPTLCAVLVVFPLVALASSGVLPTLTQVFSPSAWNRLVRTQKDAILRTIPAEASVLATFDFLPKLASRSHLYSFHNVYSGRYTLSDIPYPAPKVDFIIMDTNDPLTFSAKGFYQPDNYARIRRLLDSASWILTAHFDSVLVFKRTSDITPAPLSLVEYVSPSLKMNRNVGQSRRASIRLVGFDIGDTDNEGYVSVTLYWGKPSDSDKDYDVVLTVSDTGRVRYCGTLSPGSRIWPPQSWPAGKVMADKHHLRLRLDKESLSEVHVYAELLPLN